MSTAVATPTESGRSRSRSQSSRSTICAGASDDALADHGARHGSLAGRAAGDDRRRWPTTGRTEYDFGRVEARLNALPQFTTEIDGVEIHFIHVRSRHEDALPLIMTHGWPGR